MIEGENMSTYSQKDLVRLLAQVRQEEYEKGRADAAEDIAGALRLLSSSALTTALLTQVALGRRQPGNS